MFNVECSFFKHLQTTCQAAALEKKQFDSQYQGKLKVSKKEVLDFEQNYKPIADEEVKKLISTIDACLKQVNQLKRELDLVKLRQ